MIHKILFFLLLPCLAFAQTDKKDVYNPALSDSIPLNIPLDAGVFEISNDLKYVLSVYPNNKYLLKTNNTDSVWVSPFMWEHLYSKGIVLPNNKHVSYYNIGPTEYILCIPYDMGLHTLIRVRKKQNAYYIDHERKDWIISEQTFLFLPKYGEFAVPIIRGTDYGMIKFWKYNETGSTMVKQLYLKSIEKRSYKYYSLNNRRCVRDIIRLREKQ